VGKEEGWAQSVESCGGDCLLCGHGRGFAWIRPGHGVYGQFQQFSDLHYSACKSGVVGLGGHGPAPGWVGVYKLMGQLLFYLRLGPVLLPNRKVERSEYVAHRALLAVSTAMMVAGTVWAFTPGSGHGELEM
jgi:hypothetical protein